MQHRSGATHGCPSCGTMNCKGVLLRRSHRFPPVCRLLHRAPESSTHIGIGQGTIPPARCPGIDHERRFTECLRTPRVAAPKPLESERQIAVLLAWIVDDLVLEHFQATRNLRPRLVRRNHFVHVTVLGTYIRIGEPVAVFLDEGVA